MTRKKYPSRRVDEPLRELETYRLASSLISDCTFDHDGLPIIPRDTTLAAFAQLGACQTSTSRSLISIFDVKYQYVVAESTPTMPLVLDEADRTGSEEQMWVGGKALPRQHGICEHVLAEPPPLDALTADTLDANNELPLSTISDLTTDPRFKDKSFCQKNPTAHFYAAVPIQTTRGINIGVFCVIHTEPVETWTERHTQVMRDTSRAIMRYLDAHQASASHRGNERMTRGVGSFMEEKSTISGWQQGSHTSAYTTVPNREGALNREQQDSEELRIRQRQLLPSPGQEDPDLKKRLPDPPRDSQEVTEVVFSRAANIIREAVEVAGCIFTDASFYGRETSTNSARGQTIAKPLSPTPRSSDEENGGSASKGRNGDSKNQLPRCRVWGFSTSDTSSINGDAAPLHHTQIPERFLAKLLRRYPDGKIFSFDNNGEMHTSDSSSSDDGPDIASESLQSDQAEPRSSSPSALPKDQPWSRQREGTILLQAFPGARSVAFVPVREPGKKALYAGSFIYTRTPTRIFTVESELSYLRAFSTLAAVEIIHSKLVLEDRAKADALSSISHELRSPLHGIILGAELLHETDLSVVQGDVVHTLETCGRTLSDTLDHLLDFSKINQYKLGKRKQQQKGKQQQQEQNSALVEKSGVPAGLQNEAPRSSVQSLSSVVHLDRLVEEVVESVFAGYTFQKLTAAGVSVARGDNLHIDQMEKRRAQDEAMSDIPNSSPFKNVLVLVSIDPTLQWIFYTQPGAVRRVVMNLFANALKYTSQGAIQVSMGQKMVGTENHVVLTVSDTGSGIGKDFLGDGLFQPFSQENFLLPGTGLGLSIVKRTVGQLNGHVSVQSSVGVGTTAIATLPLDRHWPSQDDEPSPPPQTYDQGTLSLENERAELGGLRVFLKGFREHQLANSQPPGAQVTGPTGYPVIKRICEDWLRLTVVEQSQLNDYAPDLILCTLDEFDKTRHTNPTLQTPCVVVCPNAFISQDRFLKHVRRGRIVEYISQPLGPRKLARMLLLAFRRWAETRSDSSVTSSSAPSSPVLNASQLAMIPAAAPSPPQVDEARPSEASAPSTEQKDAGQEPKPEPKPASPTRDDKVEFLLVDDNKINVKLLSAVMTKLRQKWSAVHDGQAAVDWYTNGPERCKCIIMDVSMPVLDGFEATRYIRNHEEKNKLEAVTIIGLSGLASAEARAEALRCGMDLFQTKPIDFRKIKALLESHGLLA